MAENTPAPQVERGTYEILRDRLLGEARELGGKVEAVNARRVELFGGAQLAQLGSERIRTENNCVPRDLVGVGDQLLFGYNVFLGLKSSTAVEDVFSLYRFTRGSGPDGRPAFTFEPLAPIAPIAPNTTGGTFLADPEFVRDFRELYQYYKGTRLLQLRRPEGKLLAVFQTGAALTDIKVLRWTVDPDGRTAYVDNRGERDHVFPSSHDFEWTATTRDDHRRGRFPHVSVLDQVFVETVGGDLTVKVEDNTEDGRGVYREPVEDPDQSLDDAEISYARLGSLILLKVRPYREAAWRYLVFNTLNRKVDRIDAIGQACLQLPEDHGLIFPGGYYLRSGETKVFDLPTAGMEYKRVLRSPNGEDVLYLFHHRDEGRTVMLPYNLVRRQVDTPIQCHGFSFFADGAMVLFRAASDEPSRVHTLQIWQTPFCSPEHAAAAPKGGSHLETLGNAELVRGISDLLSLRREIEEQTPSRSVYEHLIAAARRAADTYHWLGHPEVGDLLATLRAVLAAAESIVDEFEKVEALRAEAGRAVAAAEEELAALAARERPADLRGVEPAVEALGRLRAVRGRIISLRELRYADLPRLDALEQQAVGHFEAVAAAAVELLRQPDAFAALHRRLEELEAEVPRVATAAQAEPVGAAVEGLGQGLELLTEVVGTLPIPDATVRTAILEAISEAFGRVNRVRALLAGHRKTLLEKEGLAEFGAQFKLFGQSVAGALALADTPEACDAQLARLMLQLEELEGRFGEIAELLGRLTEKREEVFEAFATRKQALLDARQRRAGTLVEAAGRILDGIRRRGLAFKSDDEVNAFFAADPMAAKVRDIAVRLRELGDAVRADEIEGRLKAARQEAARALRDRRDLFEDGDGVIKLGRHRFSVNRQPLELTLVPRGGGLAFHLTGTDFFEPVEDPEFEATRPYWEQSLVSETAEVYRGEYLAAQILADAEAGRNGLSLARLRDLSQGDLAETVRAYAAERYEEGYERGLHDADAARILEKLLGLLSGAGLLRFGPRARAAGALFWAFHPHEAEKAAWQVKAGSLARLRSAFSLLSASEAGGELAADLGRAVERFLAELAASVAALGLDAPDPAAVAAVAAQAGAYLAEEIAVQPVRWTASAAGAALRDRFLAQIEAAGHGRDFAEDLRRLDGNPTGDLAGRFGLARAWVAAAALPEEEELIPEAVALLLTAGRLEPRIETAATAARVDGLLGQHPRIAERGLPLRLDELLARLERFRRERVPGFRDFQARRHRLLEEGRRRFRLAELAPRVLSTFVRNRLIDEVYLPLIGDNLAKQLGTVGEGQRTDRMGLLLLVSPPGYGKTTLLEYVASRLGLTFLKVNGPALGHGVRSLDPAEAPNATARQEVERLNLALEMGNNVLLMIDDIQHTHSELLQKFISLCDAQRRIEGVWRGATRTHDLKGKRFCICMAGNPYTESGERFEIPDMLANRADTFNLGDVLAGREDLFALSYLENALTSNAVLAPLAGRSLSDLYKLVRMARQGAQPAAGEPVAADQLAHPYSALEVAEITAVLQRLTKVQEVLLRINQQYILSASQEEAFRTEPRFQLQGSYRNMNKLAEKVVAVMNDGELERLLDDHYAGEAQTLTSGAEHNLLKLAELRGRLTPEQAARWAEVKRSFARVQLLGATEGDPVARVTGQLNLLSEKMEEIGQAVAAAGAAVAERAADGDGEGGQDLAAAFAPFVEALQGNLEILVKAQAAEGKRRRPREGEVGIDGRLLQQMTEQIAQVGLRLEQVGKVLEAAGDRAPGGNGGGAPARPGAAAPAAPQPAGEALAPYLEKLDRTLAAMATAAPRTAGVVQTLPPRVMELLSEMVYQVGDDLLPLLRALTRRLKGSGLPPDPHLDDLADRTLKGFDQLKELAEALRKIDTREEAG